MISNKIVLEVEKVCFRYNAEKSHILKDIHLKTHASEICAIVGPSGCGKTTLIKLILSLLPVTKGSIRLFGKDVGDPSIGVPGPNVGYMPQEDALPSDLRVRDSLIFFGLLNNMSLENTRKRIDQVLEQVDMMRDSRKFIFQLSGGMKRRLSLAIALLHSPQLLILDEPTVGCDPILRSGIWNVLKDISKRNRTCVIITTHYYEECREVDSINFMRNKSFVAQASPEELIIMTGTRSIDESFLRICTNDFSSISSPHHVRDEFIEQESWIPESYESVNNMRDLNFLQLKIIMILVLRHIHAFVFDVTSVLSTLSLPTFVLIVAHFCGTPRIIDVPFGVVIENQTLSRDQNLLDELRINSSCSDCLHPRHFVEHMDHGVFRSIYYTNLSHAMEDLRTLKINGIVHIGDQFGEYIVQRVATHWAELQDFVVKNTKIVFYGDTTKEIVFRGLEAYLMDAYTEFWKASRENLGMKSTPPFPFEYGDPLIGSKKGGKNGKSYFTDVGQLVTNVDMLAIGVSGFSMLRELKDKTIKRYLSSGIRVHHLFIGQLFANVFFLGISSIAGMLTTIYLLDLQLQYSHLITALLVVFQVLISITFGQMIAIVLLSEVSIMILAVASGCFFSGLFGYIIPLETQPYYLYIFKYLSPFTIPGIGIRNSLLRGSTFTHSTIVESFAVSIIYFSLFTVVNLSVLGKRITQS